MINWTDDLAVGIAKIDQQHQELIRIINSLAETSKRQDSFQETDKVFSQLMDYIIVHFSDEEQLMTDARYPEFNSHIQFHQKFVNRINAYYAQFVAQETNIDQELLDFLVNWLLNHIKIEDKKYVPYMK